MNPPKKNNHPLLGEQNPWKNNSNVIWLGSTVSLIRNVDKFKFPGKLSTEKKKQIISLLTHDFIGSQELKEPKLIRAEEMSLNDKEFLVEHFLTHQSFHQASAGEAFVLDKTGEFLAVLNLKDHVLLEWLDPREELEKTWDRIVKIESELNRSVNFAFSPKFGFLTSDPTRCGTGLVITIFLHLPVLIHSNRLDEILHANKEEEVEQTGLQGDPNEVIGDIVAFHNSYTLGVTEENILSTLRNLATRLIVEEKSMRQHLKQEPDAELAEVKDKVSRAYAILMHSYQIEVIEALQALSFLKLGLDLGWIKGTSQAILNSMFFDCRRSHLMSHYEEKIEQEQLSHKRAEFIHKSLQGLELLI